MMESGPAGYTNKMKAKVQTKCAIIITDNLRAAIEHNGATTIVYQDGLRIEIPEVGILNYFCDSDANTVDSATQTNCDDGTKATMP